jgi:hypothetical protein
MEVTKFKLLDGGHGGIVIDAKEYLSSGKYQIVDDVKRTRRLKLSNELLNEVKKLKYFFLNLTGHWISPYATYYDQETRTVSDLNKDSSKAHRILKDLWNKTTITGATVKGQGFVLTGEIEVVDGKVIGLSTPFITEDDDLGFFTECVSTLNIIARGVNSFIRTHRLELESELEAVPKSLIEGKTDAEVMEILEEHLQKKGAIIMMQEGQDEIENTDDVKVNTNTKSIDSESLPEATEQKDSEPDATNSAGEQGDENVGSDVEGNVEGLSARKAREDEAIKQDKKVNPFGAPASSLPGDISGNVPKDKDGDESDPVGDISNLEHSENMGIQEDVDQKRKEEEGEDEDW